MNPNQTPISTLVGQRVLVGHPIAAEVTVLNARRVYGRVDLLVEDARGQQTWVREESVEANNKQQ